LIFSEVNFLYTPTVGYVMDVRGIIERRRLYEAAPVDLRFLSGDACAAHLSGFVTGGRLGSPSPATQRHIEQKKAAPKRGLSCSVLGRRKPRQPRLLRTDGFA